MKIIILVIVLIAIVGIALIVSLNNFDTPEEPKKKFGDDYRDAQEQKGKDFIFSLTPEAYLLEMNGGANS